MIDSFINILREYPTLAIFLTIGIGFFIGKLRIGSFSIGSVTAVLLVGVAIGQLDIPVSGPLKMFFFMLFLFSIGYSVGPDFFRSLRRAPIIINASRGPVVDNDALVDALESGLVSHAVVDCWEGEPSAINRRLLELADIATPHIAGYSYEGKGRATRRVLDARCRALDLPHIEMQQQVPAGAARSVNANAIIKSYDPLADTKILKANPDDFETLRNQYPLRHETSAGKID